MNIFAQLKREFAAFFYSPIAYVLLTAAAVLNGIVFLLIIDFLSDPRAPQGAAMQMLFGGTIFFWIIVIVLTPLITMRSIAEERHSGTMETLCTAPINDLQIVVAKYLAAVGFYLVLWLPTLAYPILLSRYSDLDPGPILSGYLGTLSVGMMFAAIGLLGSSVTRNQIIAALISFAAIMLLFVIGIFDFMAGETAPDSILRYMNMWTHMEDFGRGIVDTRHLVYYGSITLFSLFCTVQIVQARRWRG
jgi:ABC-2 type transport system permease protein